MPTGGGNPLKLTVASNGNFWTETTVTINYVRGLFGPELANWKAHDPPTLVDSLAPGDLALYLEAGTEDHLLLHDGAQYLHERLTAGGVAHTWHLGPGGHTFDFWRDRIDDSLGFFAAALAPAVP